MIRMGEIEIEGAPAKGPTTSSNATSTVEKRDKSYPSSLETSEGIPTVSLPRHAIPIKFIADDNVTIVWAYLGMPPPSPRAPTLYDFYLDPSLEAWATSKDDDDDGFGGKSTLAKDHFGREWSELLNLQESK